LAKKIVKKVDTSANNVVVHDDYDRLTYRTMEDASSTLRDLADAKADRSTLMSDLFYSFYKMDPAIKDEAAQPAKTAVETVWNLNEFKDLRASTQMDEVSSAMAVAQVAETAIEQYEKLQEECQKADEQAEKDLADGQDPGAVAGQAADKKDQAVAKYRQAMRGALKEAEDAVDGMKDGIGLLAGKDPSDLKTVPAKDRLELAEMLVDNDVIKKVARLAGRFMNIVQSAVAMSPSHGCDEIVDIGIGSDLNRLIPAELMKLHYNKRLFFKDFVEGNLLQYNMKGQEPMGNGPIIMCIDFSGSMESNDCHVWAKAIALALSTLAERQRRAFFLIIFNARIVEELNVPRGEKMTLEQRLHIVNLQPSGGTEFYPPLMRAFEYRKEESSLKPADIVFITDGQDDLDDDMMDEILNLKKETGVRIHAVGVEAGGEQVGYETLAKFSDTVTKVDSVTGTKSAKSIIGSTASLFK
jgi:uncharacterized protein with von Willebrand factor type A (vWA) domain